MQRFVGSSGSDSSIADDDSETSSWSKVLVQAVKVVTICVALMMFFSTVSTLCYLLIQYLTERSTTSVFDVHLDYAHTFPRGNLTLGDYKDQWAYADYAVSVPFRRQQFTNPLKSSRRYDIDAVFQLARSPRNQDIGKAMVRMQLVDAHGDLIASSARPLVVPFVPLAEMSLRSIFLFAIPGLFDNPRHYDKVSLQMFNAYQEVPSLGYRAKHIELVVESAQLDLAQSQIVMTDEGSRLL
jgi:hypothetical protein